jgi:hypothetical protein
VSLEPVAILVLVAGAAGYLLHRSLKALRGKPSGGGCGCDTVKPGCAGPKPGPVAKR